MNVQPVEHTGDSANLAFYTERGQPAGYLWAEVVRDDYQRAVPRFSVRVYRHRAGIIGRFTCAPLSCSVPGPLAADTVAQLIWDQAGLT
jgi:hypothetical protein